MDTRVRVLIAILCLGAIGLNAQAEPNLGSASDPLVVHAGSANDNIVGSKDTSLGTMGLSNPAGALYSPGASYSLQGSSAATAVAEPGTLILATLGLGILLFGYRSRA